MCILVAALLVGVAAPAPAQAVGSISGTVFTTTGDPVPNTVPVSLWVTAGYNIWLRITDVTPTAGAYTFTPLGAGSYYVGFNLGAADNPPATITAAIPGYLPQFFNNQALPITGTSIAVGTSAVTGINATLATLHVEDTYPNTYVQGDTLTVEWTTNRTMTGGEFLVYVAVAADTPKLLQKVVPVTAGGRDFSTALVLDVPTALIGVGYNAHVMYRASSASAWIENTTASPTTPFAVTTGFTTTVTAPTSGSFNAGGTVTVKWTTSQAIAPAAAGRFGVWVRSAIGIWTPLASAPNTSIPGNGSTSTSYSYDVSLAGATPGTGFQAIVAFSPAGGGIAATDWTCFGTSPGSFAVTVPSSITVSTPPSAANTGNVLVNWSTASSVTGDFGLWLRSAGGDWYPTNFPSTNPVLTGVTGTSFSNDLSLTWDPVPAGSYQAIVAYRPNSTSSWSSWGTSAPFTVTGIGSLKTTVTAPALGATFAKSATVAVNWAMNQDPGAGSFRVWIRSGDDSAWYGPVNAASVAGQLTYTANYVLPTSGVAVPAGDGYQAIVCWSAVINTPPYKAWGTSAPFTVTSAR